VGFCIAARVGFVVNMNFILFRRYLDATVFYAQLMGAAIVTFFADIIKLINIISSLVKTLNFVDGYPGRNESLEASNKARKELGWKTTVYIIDYI